MRPSPRPGLPGGKANAPSGNPASAGFLFPASGGIAGQGPQRDTRLRMPGLPLAEKDAPSPVPLRRTPDPHPKEAPRPAIFRRAAGPSGFAKAGVSAAGHCPGLRTLPLPRGYFCTPKARTEPSGKKQKKSPVRLFLRKTGQREHGSPAPEESFARQTLRLPFPRAAPPGNEALPLFAKKNAFCRFM